MQTTSIAPSSSSSSSTVYTPDPAAHALTAGNVLTNIGARYLAMADEPLTCGTVALMCAEATVVLALAQQLPLYAAVYFARVAEFVEDSGQHEMPSSVVDRLRDDIAPLLDGNPDLEAGWDHLLQVLADA